MKYTAPVADKEEFMMNLKYGTPANAIQQLLEKVKVHPEIEFREKGHDKDDYDEFIFRGYVEVEDILYKLPSDVQSWKVFEDFLYDITGVYVAYADYEDENQVCYEFNASAEFSANYSFIHWIEELENLLQAADMKEEIDRRLAEKIIEMKGKNELFEVQ